MRRIKSFAVVAAIMICSISQMVTRAAETQSRQTIDRLAGLARLWGTVKFCHPSLATKEIDWDAALIQTIPGVKAAKTAENYRKTLNHLLSVLNDPATCVIADAKEESNRPTGLPAPIAPQPYLEWTKDGIVSVVANDYDQFADTTNTFIKMFADFQKVFGEAAKASKVMIDLRSLRGKTSFLLEMTLPRFFPLLLTRDVILPPLRFMSHSGYPSQRESTFAYHSDLTLRSSGVIRSQALTAQNSKTPPKQAQIVILINKGSGNFYQLLTALQENRLAVVVHEGEVAESTGTVTRTVQLSDGLQANVRCAETLRRDGGTDFSPDLTVARNAREVGLEILRGERKLATPRSENQAPRTPLHIFSAVERTYAEMTYPDADYRLLALFRFWNIINDFFPYQDLMDQPWEKVLAEFIPRMEAAKDASEYVMTVAELVSRIQDSHGTINSPLYLEYLGTFSPPLRVDFIEGQTVMTGVKDPTLKIKGLEVGDIVLSVDGEKVGPRRERLARVLPASTPGRLQNRVDMQILSGKKDSPIRLQIQKATGKILDIELVRSIQGPALRTEPSKLPVSAVLKSGFGYIDISQLREADVDPALKTVKDAPGLILDMRGYPIGGNMLLGQRLARQRVCFARLQFPEYEGSTGQFTTREELQYLEPMGGPTYRGKTVVLIGTATQSAAEHTCLILESVADATFIGRPSSGADGNITYTFLPGNIAVSFSGMGVVHGDGRQLQRKGIQPQIRVEPTIAGIRSGRDEVLERAVEFLQKSLAKAQKQFK